MIYDTPTELGWYWNEHVPRPLYVEDGHVHDGGYDVGMVEDYPGEWARIRNPFEKPTD